VLSTNHRIVSGCQIRRVSVRARTGLRSRRGLLFRAPRGAAAGRCLAVGLCARAVDRARWRVLFGAVQAVLKPGL